MNERDISAGIARWDRWHYQFDLGGQLTPIHDLTRVNRHLQRKSYFFDPLVRYVGGSLEGMRVLDLGCNAGFWSLQSVLAGCEFVHGIDGRQMHIDQANFVFDALDVDPSRYTFEHGNVFETDLGRHGPFDLVLFLGLLYHISKPVELMERIAQVNSDLLVIDTRISDKSDSSFEVVKEGTRDPRNAVEPGFVLRPSKTAVEDLAESSGYRHRTLKPQFSDYTGAEDYRDDLRKAFICSRKRRLIRLKAPTER